MAASRSTTAPTNHPGIPAVLTQSQEQQVSGGTISHCKYHQPSEASSTIGNVKKFELLPFPAVPAQSQEQQVNGGTIITEVPPAIGSVEKLELHLCSQGRLGLSSVHHERQCAKSSRFTHKSALLAWKTTTPHSASCMSVHGTTTKIRERNTESHSQR